MAPKINPQAPIQPKPLEPVKPASSQVGNTGEIQAPATVPASGYRPGATGLQGKFAYAPSLRAGAFANSRAVGLNRATDVLGPNKFTVGDLVVRFGEHLEDPASPTAHDLALMNGAFTALGQNP